MVYEPLLSSRAFHEVKIMEFKDKNLMIKQYVRLGKFKAALDLINEEIAAAPATAWFWAIKGWIHFEKKEYKAATIPFTEALRLDPTASTTYFFLARCKEETGDLKGAIADYKASIKLKPKADAMVNMGLIYEELGNYDAASRMCNRAIKTDCTYKKAFIVLGLIERSVKKRDSAKRGGGLRKGMVSPIRGSGQTQKVPLRHRRIGVP